MSSLKNSFVFAAGLCFALTLVSARAQLLPGSVFPATAGVGLAGALPETAGRVVLVDFWASWCAPCEAAFPALARLHADYTPRGVVILAISVDEKAAAYAAFLKRHAPPFATVRDAAHRVVAAAKVSAMPSTVVVGRDGRVRAVFTGYHGAVTEQAIRAALDQALAEISPP